jgi:hypothetical protein
VPYKRRGDVNRAFETKAKKFNSITTAKPNDQKPQKIFSRGGLFHSPVHITPPFTKKII